MDGLIRWLTRYSYDGIYKACVSAMFGDASSQTNDLLTNASDSLFESKIVTGS